MTSAASQLTQKIMDKMEKHIAMTDKEKQGIRKDVSNVIIQDLYLTYFKEEISFTLDSFEGDLDDVTIEEIAQELLSDDGIEQTTRDTITEKVMKHLS